MSLDRILSALKSVVREMLSPDAADPTPVWTYWVPWEFQVAEVTDTTFSGIPTSSNCPLDPMVRIPLMPGIAGTLLKPAVGSLVLVAFVNGDPSRPRVVAWDQVAPTTITQDATVSQTFGPSLTRVQVTSAAVEVGTVGTQFVALAPPVTSFAAAVSTLCTALATFGGAIDAVAPGVGTPLQTAANAANASISALSFPATKLKTQ